MAVFLYILLFMIDFLKAIVLGLVQGLTEFLPISSSGHLVLLGKLFDMQDNFVLLSILLHVATLFAVIFVFWKDVLSLIKKPFSPLGKKLIIATIPTVVMALLFKDFLKDSFGGVMLPICFMLTALLLLFSDLTYKKRSTELSFKTSFIMGVAQGFAMLPGLSRSGTTISAGLFMGADKEETAKFSFLMSIPIIIASLVFEVYEIVSTGIPVTLNIWTTLAGCVVAFVSGLFAIKFMLKIIKKASWKWFAIYLVMVAIISFIVL